MLLTQEVITTHNGTTIYQLEGGVPVAAVFDHDDFGKNVAKDAAQAMEWWETDSWFRPRNRR
jgi:hypothetical protein